MFFTYFMWLALRLPFDWDEIHVPFIHTERISNNNNNSILFLNYRFIIRVSWNKRARRCTNTANQKPIWTVHFDRMKSYRSIHSIKILLCAQRRKSAHCTQPTRSRSTECRFVAFCCQCNPQYAQSKNIETKKINAHTYTHMHTRSITRTMHCTKSYRIKEETWQNVTSIRNFKSRGTVQFRMRSFLRCIREWFSNVYWPSLIKHTVKKIKYWFHQVLIGFGVHYYVRSLEFSFGFCYMYFTWACFSEQNIIFRSCTKPWQIKQRTWDM